MVLWSLNRLVGHCRTFLVSGEKLAAINVQKIQGTISQIEYSQSSEDYRAGFCRVLLKPWFLHIFLFCLLSLLTPLTNPEMARVPEPELDLALSLSNLIESHINHSWMHLLKYFDRQQTGMTMLQGTWQTFPVFTDYSITFPSLLSIRSPEWSELNLLQAFRFPYRLLQPSRWIQSLGLQLSALLVFFSSTNTPYQHKEGPGSKQQLSHILKLAKQGRW